MKNNAYCVFSSFISDTKKERKIDNKTLKMSASKKPTTINPSTNLSANKIIPAFITNKNRPNEKIVAGKVNRTIIGLTKMFNNPITKATVIAEI